MSTTERISLPPARFATATPSKVLTCHLDRLAVVYVRQSTQKQVLENRESTDRQYQLADRAAALGWRPDRVPVIDDDLGCSGQSATDRVGFQRVLAEVGLNHVGLILGSETSRLARSCKDWYQLLELAAIFGVLIADHEGLYDPGQYQDRMVLGLSGMMPEAELHVMRNRLDQGKRNKAARGELFTLAPIGYLRTPSGEMTLDPDEQVQSVVRLIFDTFARWGSARQVLVHLLAHGIRLPIRARGGANRGQIEWREPVPATVYNIPGIRCTPGRTATVGRGMIRVGRFRDGGTPAECVYQSSSGRFSAAIPWPRTSHGNSTRRTRSSCVRTSRHSQPEEPHGRDRRYWADWPRAPGVTGGCT